MKTDIKWRTELEIVEETTGEIIPKYKVEQGIYIIIKKEKRNEVSRDINGQAVGGRRIITWVVEENRQLKLL